jgi:hypothetical protein
MVITFTYITYWQSVSQPLYCEVNPSQEGLSTAKGGGKNSFFLWEKVVYNGPQSTHLPGRVCTMPKSVSQRLFLGALFCVGMVLSACSSQRVGDATYRSLEQLSCYDQHHSHGRCASPAAPE